MTTVPHRAEDRQASRKASAGTAEQGGGVGARAPKYF